MSRFALPRPARTVADPVPEAPGRLADARTPEEVAGWLRGTPGRADREAALADLVSAGSDDTRRIAALLDPATAADLLSGVDPGAASALLALLDVPVAAGLVGALPGDEAAAVLRELSRDRRDLLLEALPAARAAVVRGVLAWPRGTAGARMDPDVVTVRPSATVAETVAALRARARVPASGEVYVTSHPEPGVAPVLHGTVSYRTLALAAPGRVLAGLARPDVPAVAPDTPGEQAARVLRRHRAGAVPVVDDGRLLGALTDQDVADLVEGSATQDAERQGGALPLDLPYLAASPARLWRRRIGWLLALFAAEMYTGTVLRAFEDELETVIALAFFVPLLIGTGGNAGTQITTTLVRAMALGQVRLRDLGRVVRTEVTAGALLGLTIALVAGVFAQILGVGPEVGLTVAVSAGVIVLWASLVAAVLPPLLRRLGVDPAVVSGPMITTLVDGTGLIIYFEIARLLIPALG
ncbi:magnesium transporter [Cellulomonas sp. IC4_254]|uniref:magnesium transporter n=1 Tax=Cellulomonas sp. IC4_254 TaxID=2714040 RepID=UPI0014206490|nr:magnesium transporter [Cellulomonas sp. IC4_254]NHT19450.1 magnesium transporter [Cellulomonas sp. IC4_254]